MHTIKIASLPARGNPNNPYVDLFYDALTQHNIELIGKIEIENTWLNNSQPDAIHFHWPENVWREYSTSKNPRFFRPFIREKIPGGWRTIKYLDMLTSQKWYKKQLRTLDKVKGYYHFSRFIAHAKKNNTSIIWTYHNAEIHEGSDFIDRLGYKALASMSDLVIFHSSIAQKDFLKKYNPKCQTLIMPHGNYDGVYPPARQYKTILTELGLTDKLPIISCLGMLRTYKGLDTAVKAAALLTGKVQFLCAGWPHPSFDLQSLGEAINALPNAVLVPNFLSNQQFSDFTSVSDCLVMPYKKITGSGALLAALTLSRGVIASDLPYFREILEQHPNAGALTPTNDPQKLADSIELYLAIPHHIRNASAKALADTYAWSQLVAPIAKAIHSLTCDSSTISCNKNTDHNEKI
ncbi:hypothetical protein A9Q88_09205 [Gammaproteobacteria bacterium 50_400_T64]|nr:hypothetical protein A9Q88_09205 [Gammaproteobacteria bacterium 50_400_T64]